MLPHRMPQRPAPGIRVYPRRDENGPGGIYRTINLQFEQAGNEATAFVLLSDLKRWFPRVNTLEIQYEDGDWIPLTIRLNNNQVAVIDILHPWANHVAAYPDEAYVKQSTVLEILNECFVENVRADITSTFPYNFGAFEQHTLPTTNSALTTKPALHLLLETWRDFNPAFNSFYTSALACFQQQFNHPASEPIFVCRNRAEVNSFLFGALHRSINLIMKDQHFECRLDTTAIRGRPDVTYFRNGRPSLVIEAYHPDSFQAVDVDDIIDLFNTQDPNNPASMVRPINQIINYVLLSRARFGILTNLDCSYAFERTADNRIRVSPAQTSQDLIKIVFFLLFETIRQDHPQPPIVRAQVQVDNPANNPQNLAPGPADNALYNLRPLSTRKGRYDRQADCLHNAATFDQDVYDRFREWTFTFPEDLVTIVGSGRTGDVTLGDLFKKESPKERINVAVKLADFMKMHELKEEMRNEARILVYANTIGLKCVPKLYWAGYYGFGGVMYANCTQYIDGYRKPLSELNPHEKNLLRSALVELQEANIVHGDLKMSNILFTKSQCYVIDFGNGRIVEKDSEYNKLELYLP